MKKLLLTSVLTLAFTTSAQAYDRNTIQFGLGEDVLRQDEADDGHSAMGSIQWRGKSFDKASFFGISGFSPMAGLDVNSDGGTALYAGILYDWNFYGGMHLVPNIAAGAWFHGSSKDLGGVFEFHDSIDLQYEIDPISRIGLEFTHMSNASLYDHNPGKESVSATYSFAY